MSRSPNEVNEGAGAQSDLYKFKADFSMQNHAMKYQALVKL